MPSRLPVAHKRPPWLRYGIAIALLAVAACATWALEPFRARSPFMFFYAATALAAVFGGTGPAVLAIAGGVLIVNTAFVGATSSAVISTQELVHDFGFVFVSGLVVFLARRAMRSANTERAQREWCEVTLKSIGDAVIVTDVAGRVLTMNAIAEQLTGWSEAEALDQPIAKVFEIVNERTRAPVENPIDRVCREGKVVGLANHTVVLSRDGREIPIDDSGAPIWSEDGRVVGAVLVFRDITERYEAERQRSALLESEQQARAEAQAANRAKDEFLAVLSHELRTPLNAILGWAQVMRTKERLSGDSLRGIEVIERNARRQALLIEDVLDVSRIVSGRLSLDLGPVDLAAVVEAATESLRPMIDAKGLRLEVRGNCGGTVWGDAHRLQQVVSNLLSNAVKFTPRDGRIDVLMERTLPLCSITVRDTGVGISPDFLPLIFDRFRQEDSGSTRRYGGLGLGLTIVRHLVEMHGGSVSARSDGHDRGSTFTVRFPLSTEQPAGAPRHRRAEAADAPRLEGIRVLAVDDEPDARDFVVEVLQQAGAEARVADSIEDALRVLSEFPADVLLADLEMPGGDGFELLRRVREGGYGMPAIAVTAHTAVEDRIRVLSNGFSQHVAKPVETEELRLVVESVAAARTRGGPS